MKQLVIFLAFGLLFNSCNNRDDEVMPTNIDNSTTSALVDFNEEFYISNMQVTYVTNIPNKVLNPSPAPIKNGGGFFASGVSSKKTDKKGEVVFSGFPLIDCVYARVNGKSFEIYYQDTKKRPENIGFKNFIVFPMTEHIVVKGSGTIGGGINNLRLQYSIQNIDLIQVTATLQKKNFDAGYRANTVRIECE